MLLLLKFGQNQVNNNCDISDIKFVLGRWKGSVQSPFRVKLSLGYVRFRLSSVMVEFGLLKVGVLALLILIVVYPIIN